MSARPIVLDEPPRDARDELYTRLQNIPQEHAEAILSACDVLQGLHDQGVLEFLRGLLGSGDKVLEVAVDAAKSPESIRTLRNLLVLLNLLGSVDPEKLGIIARAIPPVVESVTRDPEPKSLWQLTYGWLWDRDLRYVLSMLQNVTKTLGQSLRRVTK